MRRLVEVWLFATSVLHLGCASDWESKQKAAHYALPNRLAVYVVTSDQVADADNAAAVLTLAETVQRGLREEGYRAEIVAASDDPPPTPRVELRVEEWEEEKSLAGDLVAPAIVGSTSTIVVECIVITADAVEPLFSGRIRVHLRTGGESSRSAESAGQDIVEEILPE